MYVVRVFEIRRDEVILTFEDEFIFMVSNDEIHSASHGTVTAFDNHICDIKESTLNFIKEICTKF